jgi:hypothetical protein
MWTLPAPCKPAESTSFGIEYIGLIRAITEAEDNNEQRLAELAFVIFLLGANYSLSPMDYECLLGFTPNSPESVAAQSAFCQIAQDHVQTFLDTGRECDAAPAVRAPGKLSRVFAWMRNHPPFRWWSFDA